MASIIDTATYLSNVLPHGDVLPHNIVYNADTTELKLIDLDEGIDAEDGVFMIRENTYTKEE